MLTMNHSSSEFQIPLKVKSSDKISVHETIQLSLLNPLVPGVHLNKPATFNMYVWPFSGHQPLKG